MYTEKDCSQ